MENYSDGLNAKASEQKHNDEQGEAAAEEVKAEATEQTEKPEGWYEKTSPKEEKEVKKPFKLILGDEHTHRKQVNMRFFSIKFGREDKDEIKKMFESDQPAFMTEIRKVIPVDIFKEYYLEIDSFSTIACNMIVCVTESKKKEE